jgi:hypothetical protein
MHARYYSAVLLAAVGVNLVSGLFETYESPASGQTPQQWRLKQQTPAEAEKQRQKTAVTIETRRE